MSRQYFGTDGIRGRVGKSPMTPDFVLRLGWAAGKVLVTQKRNKILIGKDTRISGYMFESALEAGLSAAGVDILLLGPMPTPGIAYLTRTFRAAAGIVISASHNPYYDNGVKFFSGQGQKLPDEVEYEIEQMVDQELVTVDSAELGKAERVEDAQGRYIEFCKRSIPLTIALRGLKIVLDCAHGATYNVAPDVFRELGAQVIEIGTSPDGLNINHECGATAPAALARAVLEHKAHVGVALDGDGDRLIMVDEHGEVVDGDELLYIIAKNRLEEGNRVEGVVGTQMSNLGLEHALRQLGIEFRRSAVGDRYVMELLAELGWELGGESSGHIICLDRTSTGDGIVSALQILACLANGASLSELKHGMTKYPQLLLNVALPHRIDPTTSPRIMQAVSEAESELGQRGRVLLRPSGTEPVMRVMVEGADPEMVPRLAHRIADEVREALA